MSAPGRCRSNSDARSGLLFGSLAKAATAIKNLQWTVAASPRVTATVDTIQAMGQGPRDGLGVGDGLGVRGWAGCRGWAGVLEDGDEPPVPKKIPNRLVAEPNVGRPVVGDDVEPLLTVGKFKNVKLDKGEEFAPPNSVILIVGAVGSVLVKELAKNL